MKKSRKGKRRTSYQRDTVNLYVPKHKPIPSTIYAPPVAAFPPAQAVRIPIRKRRNMVKRRITVYTPRTRPKLAKTTYYAKRGLTIHALGNAKKTIRTEPNRKRRAEHKRRHHDKHSGQAASLRSDPHGIVSTNLRRWRSQRYTDLVAAVARGIKK